MVARAGRSGVTFPSVGIKSNIWRPFGFDGNVLLAEELTMLIATAARSG